MSLPEPPLALSRHKHGGVRSGSSSRPVLRQVSVALAVITVVLLGSEVKVQYTLTIGDIVAVLLAPVWLGAARRFRGAVPLFVSGLIVLGCGFWLSELTRADHQVIAQYMISDALIFAGLLLVVGVVLWARQLVPIWVIGLAYGAGLIVGLLVNGGPDPTNPWKFGYALPVVVIVLSLGGAVNRRVLDMALLACLALVSALNDSRSLFAELALAAVMLAWQLIPRGRTVRRSIGRTVLAFAAIALIAYNVGTSLIVNGYLGQAAQTRTITQIDTSGSVILGGRPEIAASIALFLARPMGYGLGVKPTLGDVNTAKTGMSSIDYDPNNGYVEKYMFGTTFELHSVTSDLWASYGIAGILFAAMIGYLMIKWFAISTAQRSGEGLRVFLVILSLWNLVFSPFYTSAVILGIVVGLTLLPRMTKRP